VGRHYSLRRVEGKESLDASRHLRGPLFLADCEQALDSRVCTAIAVEAMTVTVTDAATGQRIDLHRSPAP
jgi:hypothetical protein